MDPSAFVPAGILMLILPVVAATLGLLLLWAIIRSAVLSALRAHQQVIDQRELDYLRSHEGNMLGDRR